MININSSVIEALGDKLSKEIYIQRIEYGNGDNEAIERIISLVDYGAEFVDFLNSNSDNLYVFGAGIWGQELVKTWGGRYKFKAFIDNNMTLYSKTILGLPIISLDKAIYSKDKAAIVLATRLYWKEILCQLEEEKFNLNQVFNLGKVQTELAEKQYFDLPALKWQREEVFIDAGAFDGNTSINFSKSCPTSISRIYLFEPDATNVQKCIRGLADMEIPYEIVNKGLWSKSTECNFFSIGNGASCIMEEREMEEDGGCGEKISVTRLDEIVKENVTFIKMDIEGAELEALCGCERLIRRYHPKLAICVYHRKEDIDEIPKLILSLNPQYRLFLRHYSLTKAETVLYAI